MLALVGLYMMFVQLQRSSGAVVANELVRQGLSPSDVAGVIGAMFAASAITQIPTGLAFDRFGATRTLAGAGVVAVIGIVVFALADSTAGLAAGRFLVGIGHGGVIAGIYMLALTWVSPSRVATLTGTVVAVAGGAGGLLATAPLLAMLERFGHTDTFLALAIATALVTALIGFFLTDAPGGKQAPSTARPDTFRQSVKGLWDVLGNRNLWPIYAMGCCFSVTFHTIGGLWAGPYLHDIQGLTREQASYGVAALVAGYHLGNAVYGPAERVLKTRKWTIVGGATVMLAIMLFLTAVPDPGVAVAIALLSMFCMCTAIYPVLAAHCRAFVPLSHAGRAIACINLAGLIVVFLGQASTGLFIELTADANGDPTQLGYRAVFGVVALILILGIAGYLRSEDAPP
jgi:predicted MFS family arabinose efflux permease